jgi:hypothetical protein
MSVPPYPNTGFKYTEPANTSWTSGHKTDISAEGKEWVDGEKQGWKVIDPNNEEPTYEPFSSIFLIARFYLISVTVNCTRS